MSLKDYSDWFNAATLICASGLLFVCSPSLAGDKIEFSSPTDTIQLPQQEKRKESSTEDLFGLRRNDKVSFGPILAPRIPVIPIPSRSSRGKSSKADSAESASGWSDDAANWGDANQWGEQSSRSLDLFGSESGSAEPSAWRSKPLPGLETRTKTEWKDLAGSTESRLDLSGEAPVDRLQDLQNALQLPARTGITPSPLDDPQRDLTSPARSTTWDLQSQKTPLTGGLRSSDSRAEHFPEKRTFGSSGYRGQSSSSVIPQRSRIDQPPLEFPKRPGDVFNVGR